MHLADRKYQIIKSYKNINNQIIQHIRYIDISNNLPSRFRYQWIHIDLIPTEQIHFLEIINISHNITIFDRGVLMFPPNNKTYVLFNHNKYYEYRL